MTSSVLRYPLKAFTEGTDYLQIDMQEYTPVGTKGTTKVITVQETQKIPFPKIEGVDHDLKEKIIVDVKKTVPDKGPTFFKDTKARFRKNTNVRPLGTVLLPIPSNIQDGNAVSFSEDSLNSVAAAAVGGVTEVMENATKTGMAGAQETLQNSLQAAGMTMDNAKSLATKYLAGKAVGIFGANVTVQQLLARQQGEIFNPNMELLFNGPTLRNFKFQFKMTPRNQEESTQVKQIIRLFKRGMAPKAGDTNLFLKTPNVFELTYRQGRRNHKFLNKFKQCFLQDIGVNYTGDGTYATYGDGTPVSMTMDLTFKELEPIYDIDYDEADAGAGVGY